MPPKDQSKNSYINGTATLGTGDRLCFRCGDTGHIQPQCDAPRPKWLSWWEQASAKAMVFPANRYAHNPNLASGGACKVGTALLRPVYGGCWRA